MWHFREELQNKGCSVHYREIDDEGNARSFTTELARWCNSAEAGSELPCFNRTFTILSTRSEVGTKTGGPLCSGSKRISYNSFLEGKELYDMRLHRLAREQVISQPLEQTFEFFAEPDNLDAITPTWLCFRIVERPQRLFEGSEIEYRLRWHGLPLHWTARIDVWNPPNEFVDIQIRGPYAVWHHTHRFHSLGQNTLVSDVVEYAAPFGMLGDILQTAVIRKDLKRIFEFRSQQIATILNPANGKDLG